MSSMAALKMILLLPFLIGAVLADDAETESDHFVDIFEPESHSEPETDWITSDSISTESGADEDLGLGRFQYADILLLSRLPHPVDKWNYVVVNASTSDRFIEESGRDDISKFTSENYPGVTIVITTNDGDTDYYYNDKLDVPVLGVEVFRTDYHFQEYMDHIYTIHNFNNRPEMWAHIFRYPNAFLPVIDRLYREYGTYLERWTPRDPELLNSIPPAPSQN